MALEQDAFRELQDAELLPWPKMNECPVHAKLDAADIARRCGQNQS